MKKVLKVSGIVHPASPYLDKNENFIYPSKGALTDIVKSDNFRLTLLNEHGEEKVKDEVGFTNKFNFDINDRVVSDKLYVYNPDVQNGIVTGEIKGLSVGMGHSGNGEMIILDGKEVPKKDKTRLYEVSFVKEPAFPECVITHWEWVDGKKKL